MDERVKIGIFHWTLPSVGRKVGGVEVFVHRLALSLVATPNSVEVISLTDAPEDATYSHRKIFRRFPFLRKKIFRLWLMPALMNFVDFKRYDVVHFHGDDGLYFFRKIPTVRTFYGSARFESRMATSKKRKYAQLFVYQLERLSSKLSDLVVGVGIETIKLYNADAIGKLFISQDLFFPGDKSKDPTFVFIGAWEGRKRGKFVAEEFLNKILPQAPNAKLFMASDFVPASDSIVDLHHPSNKVLAKIIRESWALLSASTYEGFGIPYLEAITSGTVTVTSPNPGAEFVLDNGKYGFIVSDDSYADTVLELIRSSELRREYELIGLARASEFSEMEVITEHLDWYRVAIERFSKVRSKVVRKPAAG
jgi:glycosyltransferase involved in cell wall biosynthesis